MILDSFADMLKISPPNENKIKLLFYKHDQEDNSRINKQELGILLRNFLNILINPSVE